MKSILQILTFAYCPNMWNFEKGEGDCDTDAHCSGNLKCGLNNCGSSMADGLDCCYDPSTQGNSKYGAICELLWSLMILLKATEE